MTRVDGSNFCDRERSSSASLLLGVARRDITPPVGIYARQWGAAKQDVAEGIHRPLTATMLAMKSETHEQPMLLIVLDAGWWYLPSDEWSIRGAVIDALGLEIADVLISATHTHAASSLCSDDAGKPGGELIAPYVERLREAVVEGSREALATMVPGSLSWEIGSCDLATNRDLAEPGGERIVCGYNPTQPADTTLIVGRACDATGKMLATLVNYACHPTTLAWENRLISPDYVGAMREVVEAATEHAPCLFLQGASGELSPREQYVGDTAIADRNGRRLGYAALATLEKMLPPNTQLVYAGVVESGASLATWRREPFEPLSLVRTKCVNVDLPLKPMPTEAELTEQLEACTDRTQAERLRRKRRVVQTVGSGPTCAMPAWIWRVGDAVVVAQANEAYSVFQTTLRERYPERAVVVMNLVNGACGYLSPPELYDLNIYQVWQSPFAREALGVLIDTCTQQIDQLLEDK